MTHLPEHFGGVVPPVCTPMTDSFDVDTASLQRLIEFLLEAGVHGLFVLGSTGEAAFLTDEQRATVLDVAVKTVAGRVPLVAGIIDMTTDRVLEHARTAQHAGVDALVATAPFYTRIKQAEILDHFRILHLSIDLPLIAYDIPAAVHSKIEARTTTQMAREGIISALKDSSGDEANFRSIVMEMGDRPDFSIFTGSELLVDTALLMGASGVVPGLGNVDPAGYVKLYEAARSGNWQTARTEQERLFRLFSIASVGLDRMGIGSSAMGGFKTALMLRGVIATNVTGRPQIRLNDKEVASVREALAEAGLLSAELETEEGMIAH